VPVDSSVVGDEVVQGEDALAGIVAAAEDGEDARPEVEDKLVGVRVKGRMGAPHLEHAPHATEDAGAPALVVCEFRLQGGEVEIGAVDAADTAGASDTVVVIPGSEQAVDVDTRHSFERHRDGLGNEETGDLDLDTSVEAGVVQRVEVGDVEFVGSNGTVRVTLVTNISAMITGELD